LMVIIVLAVVGIFLFCRKRKIKLSNRDEMDSFQIPDEPVSSNANSEEGGESYSYQAGESKGSDGADEYLSTTKIKMSSTFNWKSKGMKTGKIR
jgi:hypothetical protein